MAGRDVRPTTRPTRIYGVRDAIRDELRENPIPRWRLLVELVLFVLALFVIVVWLGAILALGAAPAAPR